MPETLPYHPIIAGVPSTATGKICLGIKINSVWFNIYIIQLIKWWNELEQVFFNGSLKCTQACPLDCSNASWGTWRFGNHWSRSKCRLNYHIPLINRINKGSEVAFDIRLLWSKTTSFWQAENATEDTLKLGVFFDSVRRTDSRLRNCHNLVTPLLFRAHEHQTRETNVAIVSRFERTVFHAEW